ncbi:putative rna-binding protein c4f6.14 [Acrodontium crateriforme]|uniref:Rna-binding protein c4f6.14 n=1 Tax=Acrodontium crateriforme TaxID=150365 RepID=A0AAQ3RB14_9PEZI|nr:putative rna-binding protein c4f6.14 [Acrodontium crateriforme]
MAPAQKKLRLSNGTGADVDVLEGLAEDSKLQDPAKSQQNRSLFVRALPASTTTESLTALFSDSYPIKHATAVIDRETKLCKGFGFVTFADPEDAERAKAEFNGHIIEGKKLRIELAEARQREKNAAGTENPEGEAAKVPKGRPENELPPAQSKLIVRNLPWTIKSSEELSKHFMSFGKVKQAYIPKKRGGLMAGFGFVVMRGRKNAEKALEGVNGKEVDGRTLAVDWAVEKEAYETAIKDEEEEDTSNAGEDATSNDDKDDDREHLDGMSDYEDDDEEPASDGNEEDDDIDVEDADEEDDHAHNDQPEDKSSTIFVRNLPFTCTDEDLEDHFSRFGSTRYARVVMDWETGRSKGTGFVCFYDSSSADDCLRNAPQRTMLSEADKAKEKANAQPTNSILQNDMADPTGQYTLDGRVLQCSRAVEKGEANRLASEGLAHRSKRDKDKRRLYLLGEGTIPSNTKLWESLAPSERTMREASAKQRKNLIEGNPSLHLSLTRLSVRNIPRSVGSKELKALAREAVVGFATDVKEGKRQKLSKEELARGGEEMQEAEKARKKSGKGLVKQAKVVFEGAGGSKISEDTGAGRSRGYGFIEYHTHRSALMGLRWLNGHAIGYKVKEGGKGLTKDEVQDRKKRLIVEFAIENAQVVLRRNDREVKARERSKAVSEGRAQAITKKEDKGKFGNGSKKGKDFKGKDGKPSSRKRKRGVDDAVVQTEAGEESKQNRGKKDADEKTKKRNQIIGRKRAMRKARKGGGK